MYVSLLLVLHADLLSDDLEIWLLLHVFHADQQEMEVFFIEELRGCGWRHVSRCFLGMRKYVC